MKNIKFLVAYSVVQLCGFGITALQSVRARVLNGRGKR